MKLDKEFVKQLVEQAIPFHKFLGIELLELKQGYAKIRVPFREEVIGDPRSRRWHGGVLATVLDSVGGLAGMTHSSSLEDKLATIDLRVDYLKGAQASPIVAEGEIVRLGNRILVTKMSVFQEDSQELLAEGKGVFNFIRLKEEKKPDASPE